MTRNLNLTQGLMFSQGLLLALVDKGLTRDAAYRLVQRPAMQVWEQGGTFKERVLADPEIGKYLSTAELEELFDLKHHLRHVDELFQRVFAA